MNLLRLTIILAGLAMVGPFATDTYLPSFNAIANTFVVSPELLPQTLSVYLIGFALMMLAYGTLSDSYGRKKMILFSLIVFIAASIGAALAPNFEVFLFFRFIQGTSAGAGSVIGRAIVRDMFDGPTAQSMLAKVSMIFAVAPAIAPVVGGYLHVHGGWRFTFVFMAVVSILLLWASFKYLPETLAEEKRIPLKFRPLVKNYKMALTTPAFVLNCLAIGLAFGGFSVYIAAASNFIIDILGMTETEFAWMFIPMVVGIFLGANVNSRLAHKADPIAMIKTGFLIMGLSAVINISYNYFASVPQVPWAVLPIFVFSFGLSLSMPGMTVVSLSFFPGMTGMASSLQSFMQMFVFALSVGVFAPFLFGSSLKLALGAGASIGLGFIFWYISYKLMKRKNVAS